jgi:hypothetical protein
MFLATNLRDEVLLPVDIMSRCISSRIIRRISSVFGLFAISSATQLMIAGSLCVTAKDPAGQPLSGTSITITRAQESESLNALSRAHSRTDNDGQACFFQLPDGIYNVEFSLQGFLTVSYQGVRINILRPAILEVVMLFGDVIEHDVSPPLAKVTGILKVRGDLLAEAIICAYDKQSNNLVNCSRSDRFGQFALLLEPESYIIEIRHKDKVYFRGRINIPRAGIYSELIPKRLEEIKQP